MKNIREMLEKTKVHVISEMQNIKMRSSVTAVITGSAALSIQYPDIYTEKACENVDITLRVNLMDRENRGDSGVMNIKRDIDTELSRVASLYGAKLFKERERYTEELETCGIEIDSGYERERDFTYDITENACILEVSRRIYVEIDGKKYNILKVRIYVQMMYNMYIQTNENYGELTSIEIASTEDAVQFILKSMYREAIDVRRFYLNTGRLKKQYLIGMCEYTRELAKVVQNISNAPRNYGDQKVYTVKIMSDIIKSLNKYYLIGKVVDGRVVISHGNEQANIEVLINQIQVMAHETKKKYAFRMKKYIQDIRDIIEELRFDQMRNVKSVAINNHDVKDSADTRWSERVVVTV